MKRCPKCESSLVRFERSSGYAGYRCKCGEWSYSEDMLPALGGIGKKVYIAGPMTGLPEHNFPAFNEAEKALRERGFIPLNPAGNPMGLSPADYMRIDLAMVGVSDLVAMLPGWKLSIGANAEYSTAVSYRIEVRDISHFIENYPVLDK